MPERSRRPPDCAARAAGGFLLLLLVVASGPARAANAPPAEADLVRQIKVDVFDENWSAVLKGCEDLLARYPLSDSAARAEFYRARALSRLPGREEDAVAGFRQFVERHSDEKLLSEQAWTSLFALVCGARRANASGCPGTLAEGLANPSAYVSTLAAIRASDTRDERLRARALAVLKRALATQSEPDIRNEILIAILKIDPKQVPPPPPPESAAAPAASPRVAPTGPAAAAGSAPAARAPALIRMTIYNKEEGRYDLRINLPVAFAQMLLDALGEDAKAEIRGEAARRGIDLGNVFDAIQKAGPGRFLEVDTDETRIEVWIE